MTPFYPFAGVRFSQFSHRVPPPSPRRGQETNHVSQSAWQTRPKIITDRTEQSIYRRVYICTIILNVISPCTVRVSRLYSRHLLHVLVRKRKEYVLLIATRSKERREICVKRFKNESVSLPRRLVRSVYTRRSNFQNVGIL